MPSARLSLGPVLFNWDPLSWRDFYFRMADESCVDTVYLGEVVCSKRVPFFEPFRSEVVSRLGRAGKQVVFSTLAEVMVKHERRLTERMCAMVDVPIEANDASALYHLRGRPHRVGPFVNTYNEETLAFLAARGAKHVTLPPELPGSAMAGLGEKAREMGVTLEAQVFGRMPLALSARCYHARAHGRTKDNCGMVCAENPDGMELETLQGRPFLAVNGIQTLSHACLNLVRELPEMQRAGVTDFRLSPHSYDMVEIASLFRKALDRELGLDEAAVELGRVPGRPTEGLPFCNGFYHRLAGYEWATPD